MALWANGKSPDCKSGDSGSIPGGASRQHSHREMEKAIWELISASILKTAPNKPGALYKKLRKETRDVLSTAISKDFYQRTNWVKNDKHK